MAKTKNPKKEFDPSELSPIVARRVLQDLLEQQPELKLAVAALANAAIKNPRMEDLAEEIEGALNHISEGDIYINSGRTWRGYREPEEGAAEVFSEVMHPYFERVEELFRKKDEQNALIMCEAIILALYRVKHGDHFSEIEEYAEDLPEETADGRHGFGAQQEIYSRRGLGDSTRIRLFRLTLCINTCLNGTGS